MNKLLKYIYVGGTVQNWQSNHSQHLQQKFRVEFFFWCVDLHSIQQRSSCVQMIKFPHRCMNSSPAPEEDNVGHRSDRGILRLLGYHALPMLRCIRACARGHPPQLHRSGRDSGANERENELSATCLYPTHVSHGAVLRLGICPGLLLAVYGVFKLAPRPVASMGTAARDGLRDGCGSLATCML